MKIKLTHNMLTVNGKRCGVHIVTGPWVPGVPAELIKLRPKRNLFPREFRDALAVENNSDSMTDYFEADCIRLLPGHPLYEAAKNAA